MLRSRYIEAWDAPDSPGPLPMPLQHLATAEAHQRVRKAAAAGSPTAAELAVTPVGQIVGSMNQRLPARQVVSDMIDEYLDTVERMARLIEETEKQT
jgi:NAD(P)H-dependent flavin oxidoreductase YrpB (nitropropane dioxygenase family)